MRPGEKITQIVPAAGYYAVYGEGDEMTYNPVATSLSSPGARGESATFQRQRV
jgi:hypothetical protein